jgi:hypothetical protein
MLRAKVIDGSLLPDPNPQLKLIKRDQDLTDEVNYLYFKFTKLQLRIRILMFYQEEIYEKQVSKT